MAKDNKRTISKVKIYIIKVSQNLIILLSKLTIIDVINIDISIEANIIKQLILSSI